MIVFCLWTSNSCDVYLFELIAVLKKDCIKWHRTSLQPQRNVSVTDFTLIYIHLICLTHILHSVHFNFGFGNLSLPDRYEPMMELKRLEERYVLLMEDTPSDCWASMISHRTSRWLLLYLFFSSALCLLQVFAQHVYNCVLYTKIANSSRGKPTPNWQRRPTKTLLFLQVAELSQAGRDSVKGWTSEPVWQLLRLNRWEITFQGRGALKSQRDSSSQTIYIQIEPFLLFASLVINKVKGYAGCLQCLSPIGSTGNAKQEIVLTDRHLSNISNTLKHFILFKDK